MDKSCKIQEDSFVPIFTCKSCSTHGEDMLQYRPQCEPCDKRKRVNSSAELPRDKRKTSKQIIEAEEDREAKRQSLGLPFGVRVQENSDKTESDNIEKADAIEQVMNHVEINLKINPRSARDELINPNGQALLR